VNDARCAYVNHGWGHASSWCVASSDLQRKKERKREKKREKEREKEREKRETAASFLVLWLCCILFRNLIEEGLGFVSRLAPDW
jgi:hypothetical protein